MKIDESRPDSIKSFSTPLCYGVVASTPRGDLSEAVEDEPLGDRKDETFDPLGDLIDEVPPLSEA